MAGSDYILTPRKRKPAELLTCFSETTREISQSASSLTSDSSSAQMIKSST
jgi:hypothetical protein